MDLDGDSISKEAALAMLQAEVELRRSDMIQNMYDQYRMTHGGYVEENVQMTILSDFGYAASMENLDEYRHMIWKYRQVPEVNQQIFFMKYNIMRQGDLKVGDVAPDVPLATLKEKPLRLYDFMDDKPLVILSGSLT